MNAVLPLRPSRRRLAALALWTGVVLSAIVAVSLGGAASAADPDASLTVTSTDATDPNNVGVELIYTGTGTTAELSLDGVSAGTADLTPSKVDTALVLVGDNNAASENASTRAVAKAISKLGPDRKAGRDQVAVVASGGGARSIMPLSSDAGRLTQDLKGFSLASEKDDALLDAVRLGAEIAQTSTADRQMVVIRTAPESGSVSSALEVHRQLLDAQVRLSVIDAAPEATDAPMFAQWASETGGVYLQTSLDDLDAPVAAVADRMSGRYALTASDLKLGEERGNLGITLPDAVAEASVQPGAALTTPTQLEPVALAGGGLFSFLDSRLLQLAIPALVVAALLGIGIAVMQFMAHSEDGVGARLRAYESVGMAAVADDDEEQTTIFGSSEVVRKAVEASERLAAERGVSGRFERLILMADLSVRPGEVVFGMLALAVVVLLLGTMLGGPFVGVILALLGAAIPYMILQFKASRRRRRFEMQLPDALGLLAGTLRAGYSIAQAIASVGEDMPDPLGIELRRAVSEAQLGRPIEDALYRVADRMESRDFHWAVLAIEIQREVGGNLSELLDTVASTMVERERLRREIKGLTAEGRMSAMVLGALPIGMVAFMYVSNPGYLDPLVSTTLGKVLLAYSTLSMLGGFAWMKKIITIEV